MSEPRRAAGPSRAIIPSRALTTPRRRVPRWLIALVLVLAGVGVLLYPVLATQHNNMAQRHFAEQYNRDVAHLAPEKVQQRLADARAYNKTLQGVPILDPYLTSVEAQQGDAYRSYTRQLGDFGVMARVRVPRLGIDLPVRHGTGEEALAKGAGHLYGTSLPVGGADTHAVLTSHTGFASATLFDHLKDAREGDEVIIGVYGQELHYVVDQIKVVLPSEIQDLRPEAGRDLVTLFTCTPYGVNSHRLLVRAHRVPAPSAQPAAAGATPFGLEPWMYGCLAGAVAGLVALVVIVGKETRSPRRRGRRAVGARGRPAGVPIPLRAIG